MSTQTTPEPLLELKNLKMHFPRRSGFFQRITGSIRAVDGVDISIFPGETLGLVGESGCGKSTVARCVVRAYEPTAGSMLYRPEGGAPVDLATLDETELMPYRKHIRMIFQDPYSSLNPRMTVQELIAEPIRNLEDVPKSEREDRVVELLKRVGLRPDYRTRYPHAFSGGERQRIVIARALSLNPRLVIADEAVSALDVSVRAQVLNLMKRLQRDFNLTYLFIGHDLSVVEHICNRVAVMYVGRLVELADTKSLYSRPRHPYTEALLSAVPVPDPDLRDPERQILLEGDVPDPGNPPSGCYFHPRCRYTQERCRTDDPPLREIVPGHFAACHFAESLTLRGVTETRARVEPEPVRT
jgi:peptide/nickel transport system ATP-binding protein